MSVRMKALNRVFNHIAFPPRLPGRHDTEDEVQEVQDDLIQRVLDALEVIADANNEHTTRAWSSIANVLRVCREINKDGTTNGAMLLNVLNNMKPGDAIVIYVAQQNACLIVRWERENDQEIVFEVFETSSTAESTLAAKSCLQWDFPGSAVSLPISHFKDPVFLSSFTTFIERASCEVLDEFCPKTRKAGVDVSETRNTVNPAIITQFLMTLLEANGNRVYPPLLRKRVRDDVCWDKAELPWRRSPFWLVLRVCSQRLLYLDLGGEVGRLQYKFMMCMLMADLLEDSVKTIDQELVNFLKTKLCRRLAKLEFEREGSSGAIYEVYTRLFKIVEPACQRSISATTLALERGWEHFKDQIRRRIPHLPMRAEEKDMQLSLRHSFTYLSNILDHSKEPPQPRTAIDLSFLTQGCKEDTTEDFASLTKRYSILAQKEMDIEAQAYDIPCSKNECEELCVKVARQIVDYMTTVGDAYNENPEQLGTYILYVFDLWVRMDKCATVSYPLLVNYHPGFKPELLDVLLLSRLSHIERLQEIQIYLSERCGRALTNTMTIFSDPSPGGFTHRYFDLEDADYLHTLQRKVEDESLKARARKQKEMKNVNERYNDLTEKIAASHCNRQTNLDGKHDIRSCSHCYYVRKRRRLEIVVHEDYLPSNEKIVQKRATVFEMGLPKAFSVYRSATWKIVSTLSNWTGSTRSTAPKVLLEAYSQLNTYHTKQGQGISLASDTKSYLGTHYKSRALPVTTTDILLPLGLRFAYYDTDREMWLRDFREDLTFAHHFSLKLPNCIQECPPKLSVHEFCAHQNAMSGKHRRWLSILTELGSSNINFSLQDTVYLFRHLFMQAGPRLKHDNLRVIHCVFRDPRFCDMLYKQIFRQVDSITVNWRETYHMETILTMTIQMCAYCCREALPKAFALLLRIRGVVSTWVTALREEMRNAQEKNIAEQTAKYCFLSALLCRRTFAFEASNSRKLTTESFRCFVEATISMQESLMVDISQLTILPRNMLIRDIKLSVIFGPMLRSSPTEYSWGLESAINTCWSGVNASHRLYSEWRFVPNPQAWWITSTVREASSNVAQQLHYHLLEGHLLVDGKSIGKLPADVRDLDILKELFGNQRLVVSSSTMPGMTYMLTTDKQGHKIHLGYRSQCWVIRAQKRERTLELIPRDVFGSGTALDLPHHLMDKCFHWLDLSSSVLEIRRPGHPWEESNRILNVRTRRANWPRASLVDPHSTLFGSIAEIFSHFEEPQMLTVVQPFRANLTVELKRMNLTFNVNKKNLLQCKQLEAEISPIQDPGTLVHNHSQRIRRRERYTLVKLENDGHYASPQESRLLYLKAQLHAYTSWFITDPLTRRIGTEEALSCLQSGSCRPWVPLGRVSLDILGRIAALSPKHEYYPKGSKSQQIVQWNCGLAMSAQHEAYKEVVDTILKKSERLAVFNPEYVIVPRNTFFGDPYLRERSFWRRHIYERRSVSCPEMVPPLDTPYVGRDRLLSSKSTSNTREIVHLLSQRMPMIQTTTKLLSKLEQWSLIGGYTGTFTPHSIKECLVINLAHEWGGLVNLYRSCNAKAVYDLMFHLGVMAFRHDVDMAGLGVIIAFFLVEDLKKLEYPLFDAFHLVENLVRPCCESFEGYHTSKLRKRPKPHEGVRLIEIAKEEYALKCIAECQRLANFFVKQWPCSLPKVEGFVTDCIDVSEAVDQVLPEWERIFRKLQLRTHIDQVQITLNRHSITPNVASGPSANLESELFGGMTLGYALPSLEKQVQMEGPKLDTHRNVKNSKLWMGKKNVDESRISLRRNSATDSPGLIELKKIVMGVSKTSCPVRIAYAEDLQKSITALENTETDTTIHNNEGFILNIPWEIGVQWFNNEIEGARTNVDRCYNQINTALSYGEPQFRWLKQGGLWPCISPTSILQQFRSTLNFQLGPGMKEAFVSYGLAIVYLQRLIRMKQAFGKSNKAKLQQELTNNGHKNWNPTDCPDWLLLQIDSNIQIHTDQVSVTHEMISPSSDSNSILQMNMGQGKTSVIMSMVACVLANKKMVCCLIIPNALLSQTVQIMGSHLGGLVGREVTYIPFSRRTPTAVDLIKMYCALYEETLYNLGIMLGIPEHLLSFKLSRLQWIVDREINNARYMVEVQRWLNRGCRDILDKCNFTLAVKTQLIYPSGSQITVLGLVAQHLHKLVQQFPKSISIIEQPNIGFPVIYLLRNNVEKALLERIVDHISSGKQRAAIQEFISKTIVDTRTIKHISNLFPDTPKVRKVIYLLHGLLIHSILILCLKKRWKVQYDLHPARDSVAVLFHAKDVPSENTEWGHPNGLMLRSDNPTNIININNKGQTVVVNHFLANVLQASGWDIPLHNSSLASLPVVPVLHPGVTTGFSEQQDLSGLSHTNAEVLTYLLQKRNCQYAMAALLQFLKKNKIRVLIDAGAFILEMDNHDHALAATGKQIPLLGTPFCENMENCLVYLDEAHTRGTDLRLPASARGALTLGLNQTKDHTVQAAMRLRQLATTQSVIFIAPPEVHMSILDIRGKALGDRLDSSDVVEWLLVQTCNSNRELQSLYSAQGFDFCHRMEAAVTHDKLLESSINRDEYVRKIQQHESQTLEHLYGPKLIDKQMISQSTDMTSLGPFHGSLNTILEALTRIQQESQLLTRIPNEALEEVEQEREVAYEIEEEREMQQPCRMKALKFLGLNESILRFVKTGILEGDDGYIKAAIFLESTELGQKHGIEGSGLVSQLYVSTEFTRTVRLKKGKKNDSYLRPVNWLLLNPMTNICIVIIPEEAEELIPVLRRMLHFDSLNFYALPSLPESWNPPSWIRFELGVLSGRLYFEFSDNNFLIDRLRIDPETLLPKVELGGEDMSNINEHGKGCLSFLEEWLTLRRHGQDISHTPMGYSREETDQENGVFQTTGYTAPSENEEAYYDSDDFEDVDMGI
ncbi:hypothetical protein BDV25DRAFT_168741 [Aspergillus avenaceus]|uniref:ubiquitinyl hydrolase 1 n=1 Tax=Aspergillus avenaceus TaxID=36643 RepID=A0A5N6U506_ASPAV|nr:hypothetical protein BDV25DRAFT_168741 [Aspergillus avenaceus]